MVAVDGAGFAPAGRLRRLLGRILLVAGLATVGWLLSVLFAGYAAATEEPAGTPRPVVPPAADQTEAPTNEPDVAPEDMATEAEPATHSGILGVLTSALTHTVTPAVTQRVTHQANDDPATFTPAATGTAVQVTGEPTATPQAPETRVPRVTAAERTASAPVRTHAPPVIPVAAPTATSAPDHTPRAVADAIPRHKKPDPADRDRDHAGEDGPRSPVQAPAPVSPGGTSVTGSPDSAGGGRGAHGVPTTTVAPPPHATAGYTTRGHAAEATGRVTGLPATSPD